MRIGWYCDLHGQL